LHCIFPSKVNPWKKDCTLSDPDPFFQKIRKQGTGVPKPATHNPVPPVAQATPESGGEKLNWTQINTDEPDQKTNTVKEV
jgi:hypothetical protein